jgi:hypothetical protein
VQSGTERYIKHFSAERFTQSNEDFGTDHVPADDGHFFRADGRILTWTEYVLSGATQPQSFSGWSDEGWAVRSLLPRTKKIATNNKGGSSEVVRFSFTKVCAHWDGERNGKGRAYQPMLEVQGRRGMDKQQLPLAHDGFTYWIDVPVQQLGTPGQKVSLMYLSSMDNKDARGVSMDDFGGSDGFVQALNRKARGWQGLAVWELC